MPTPPTQNKYSTKVILFRIHQSTLIGILHIYIYTGIYIIVVGLLYYIVLLRGVCVNTKKTPYLFSIDFDVGDIILENCRDVDLRELVLRENYK